MARKKKSDTQWLQPTSPPPPLFTGVKEKDFVKQVNDELIERVIGQQVAYFAIDINSSNFHPIYGEAIEKTFLPPVRVYALVKWEGQTNLFTEGLGIDKQTSIEIHFHKRRLTEDQDLYVREGDYVLYGDRYYEIVSLNEPKQLFGQAESKFEIVAKCKRARDSLFAPKFTAGTVPTKRETTSTATTTYSGNGIVRPNNGGGNQIGAGSFTTITVSGLSNLNGGVNVTGNLNVTGNILLNGNPLTLSGSSIVYNTRRVSSSYTVQLDDNYVGVDAITSGIVITLPPLTTVENGRVFIIKDETGLSDTNHVTLSASTGETIDLEPFTTLDIDHVSVSVYKTINGWFIF